MFARETRVHLLDHNFGGHDESGNRGSGVRTHYSRRNSVPARPGVSRHWETRLKLAAKAWQASRSSRIRSSRNNSRSISGSSSSSRSNSGKNRIGKGREKRARQ